MKRLVGLLVFAGATAQAHLAPAAADVPVTMSAAEQARMGVASTVLEARSIRDSVEAVVQAIDPTPLAVLDSDLAAAAAAADASASELRRTAGLAALDRSASQQALETARARAAADRAALTLLRRRLALEWGPAFAARSSAERADLIAAVARGSAAVLRADAPLRPAGIEGRVLIETAADAAPIAAEPLGRAALAEQRMQTIGLYCIVRGPAAAMLRPGRVFPGRIETDATRTGVVVPRSALVRLDGAVWAYVRTGEEAFVRRQLVDTRPLADGWFVQVGFPPGTAVVDRGAGTLLALERADEAAEAD